ncbi:MAG: TRAP transporter small permease [Rhodobacterales bacterium]|nr:TRAP transporter small permease [Rhodobacterales bacterium]
MLQTLNSALATLTRWLAWLGMLALMAAVLMTTADVVLRKAANISFAGTVDITQLMVMTAAYLAIPFAFATRSHVAVAMLTDRLPRRALALVQALGGLLAVALMVAIAHYGRLQALQELAYGDASLTLGIPKIWYWVPLLAGAGLSVAVMGVMTLTYLYTAVTGRGLLSMGED